MGQLIAAGVFGLIAFSLFVYVIISKVIIEQGQLVPGIALLVMIAAGILALVLSNYKKLSQHAASLRETLKPEELPNPIPDKLLNEFDLTPPPSVTEDTTELLFVEKKDRAKEG